MVTKQYPLGNEGLRPALPKDTAWLPTVTDGVVNFEIQVNSMVPKYKIAGLAGIATGIGLIGEFLFFSISGYSPDKFKTYAESLAFLQQHGVLALRIAVLFGIAGAAVRIIYVAGLAARLRAKSPTQAVATLYFGILGSIGHGLVALSFYTGLPLLLKFA